MLKFKLEMVKSVDQRPSWDRYFMDIAYMVARRSTCLRRQTGAVIVLDKRILTTGYNGTPHGLKHCSDIGCLRERMGIPSGKQHELCRGLHAEQNAIVQAALYGVSISGGTIYTTHEPCSLCAKMIANGRLVKVIYAEEYPDELARSILEEANIERVHLDRIRG